jgi:hypothetical protein
MAKYMQIAEQARHTANRLFDLIPEEKRHEAGPLIGTLVNLGIRISPRAVQSTVRFNAVTKAVEDLPVNVSMYEVEDEKTGRTYKAITINPTNKSRSSPLV